MEIKYVVLLVWGGLWLIFLYLYIGPELRKAHAIPGAVVSKEGENDEGAAIEAVLGLLKSARKEFEAYDDGDDESRLYNSKAFIDEVELRLEDSEFRVTAMFNVERDLRFIRHFRQENPNRKGKIKIFVRARGDVDPIHYKIIDGGKKAYLTRHKFEDQKRRYQSFDFSGVDESLLPEADKLWFGDVRQKKENFRLIVGEE